MINSKVAHVRAALRQPVDGEHLCHWPGCTTPVSPAVWGCRPHWYLLPKELQAEIWRAYRPGQEISKTPSPQYIAAANRVQTFALAHEAKMNALPPVPVTCDLFGPLS